VRRILVALLVVECFFGLEELLVCLMLPVIVAWIILHTACLRIS
jgi:hypothetical protein